MWDTALAEKWVGGNARRRPYDAARAWAADLADQIHGGRYAAPSQAWADGIDLDDPIATAMLWANESNAVVCSIGEPCPPFLPSKFPLFFYVCKFSSNSMDKLWQQDDHDYRKWFDLYNYTRQLWLYMFLLF